jgi:hypothetical protein
MDLPAVSRMRKTGEFRGRRLQASLPCGGALYTICGRAEQTIRVFGGASS